ncbi:SURF1 family protein [Ammonicoccus fulvus]|uniref:SURF1-like protein n=1 Tax=Ammonicoccus fulvus TaxID=3138240 RepID=A0ABZ3FM94_9ACTN
MSRFWKRAIALAVFVVVLGVAFVLLGQWQLDRLDQRRAKNDVILQHEQSPPKPYDQVFGPVITDADQWQRVVLTGTFDASQQFQVRYRYNNSRPGYEVVTPLRTTRGDVVLVDRGFIDLPSGQQIPDVLPPPPPGEVTVVGHVRRNENGKPQAINPVNNQVRLINAPAISAVLPYPVMDGWVAALEVTPPQQPQFQTLALPEISDGPHFWYAMQWFLFALIGVTGLVVFVRSDIRERRARRTPGSPVTASAARTPGAGPDTP